MENKNYTIKDIARMAGVSAGTVDRVLHNRGDVSEVSMAKVKKVLDEIDYHPNRFAIGLAAKKRYRIACIIPYYIEHDYWYAVAQGIERAAQEMGSFNVTVGFFYYRHADKASFADACVRLQDEEVDAVLIAPNFHEETIRLTGTLDERGVPYVLIDFNVEQANALCYIGQDSEASGYIAAKILMRHYRPGRELVFFLNNQKDNPAEIQMQRRLEGFMRYLSESGHAVRIRDLVLHKEDEAANRLLLDAFFADYPQTALGVVFNSRVYQVAGYLHERGKCLAGLIGYDLLQRNMEYLRSGEVSYLIGQRPGLQGYYGIRALCNRVVFKQSVAPMKYMPIDILMKENIDFYFEFE